MDKAPPDRTAHHTQQRRRRRRPHPRTNEPSCAP